MTAGAKKFSPGFAPVIATRQTLGVSNQAMASHKEEILFGRPSRHMLTLDSFVETTEFEVVPKCPFTAETIGI